MTMPSGSPRCSCTITRSDTSFARQIRTSSGSTKLPRFKRCEFGKSSLTSLVKALSLLLGSWAVVMTIFGSSTPARRYSSSLESWNTSVFSSSKSISFLSSTASFCSSVGICLPPVQYGQVRI